MCKYCESVLVFTLLPSLLPATGVIISCSGVHNAHVGSCNWCYYFLFRGAQCTSLVVQLVLLFLVPGCTMHMLGRATGVIISCSGVHNAHLGSCNWCYYFLFWGAQITMHILGRACPLVHVNCGV